MARDQRRYAPEGNLIISTLVVLNGIVLKVGFISDSKVYWWLCLTLPLLVIAVLNAKKHGHDNT
jgi:hypothetical protein